MPLTPADVHNITFTKPPIGKRGYHEGEVDAFLDLVRTELARLSQENTTLRTQLTQLDEQLRTQALDTEANPELLPSLGPVDTPSGLSLRQQLFPGADHDGQATKVLGLAQQIADQVTDEAKAQAQEMLDQARTTYEQILSQAQAKAERMITEARGRAETMLNDARTTAQTLQRKAQDNAAARERDAARKHTEMINSIDQEKRILDDLRTYHHNYRTLLKTYLQSHFHELDERGSAPADTTSSLDPTEFSARITPESHHFDPSTHPPAGPRADPAKHSPPRKPSNRKNNSEPESAGTTRWRPAV